MASSSIADGTTESTPTYGPSSLLAPVLCAVSGKQRQLGVYGAQSIGNGAILIARVYVHAGMRRVRLRSYQGQRISEFDSP